MIGNDLRLREAQRYTVRLLYSEKPLATRAIQAQQWP